MTFRHAIAFGVPEPPHGESDPILGGEERTVTWEDYTDVIGTWPGVSVPGTTPFTFTNGHPCFAEVTVWVIGDIANSGSVHVRAELLHDGVVVNDFENDVPPAGAQGFALLSPTFTDGGVISVKVINQGSETVYIGDSVTEFSSQFDAYDEFVEGGGVGAARSWAVLIE